LVWSIEEEMFVATPMKCEYREVQFWKK
jgi:hypothetical protein